jgi:isopenicillin N synthase-like dioxygenase
MDEVPLIDLSAAHRSGRAGREAVAARIDEACREIGSQSPVMTGPRAWSRICARRRTRSSRDPRRRDEGARD